MTDSVFLWIVVISLVLTVIMFMTRRISTLRSIPVTDERVAGLTAAGFLPLVECPRGRDACLHCLLVDHCVVHRLSELGLTPGTRVRVVQDAGGPMLLSVRGSRVALGRDLAARVWVELPEREPGKLSYGKSIEDAIS